MSASKYMWFAKSGTTAACYLYRQYGPGGDLLYVGVSLEPLRRQLAHFKTADWRTQIFRILIEPFETREAALEAERQAIRQELPKCNTTYNGRRHPLQKLAAAVASPAAECGWPPPFT